jgi:hypothetical protein
MTAAESCVGTIFFRPGRLCSLNAFVLLAGGLAGEHCATLATQVTAAIVHTAHMDEHVGLVRRALAALAAGIGAARRVRGLMGCAVRRHAKSLRAVGAFERPPMRMLCAEVSGARTFGAE